MVSVLSSYLRTRGLGPTIDSVHHEADLLCICGTSEVCVDLLGLLLVKGNEAVKNVITCSAVIGTTCAKSCQYTRTYAVDTCQTWILRTFVIGEIIFHWAHRQLLFEAINLVQKQDNRCLCKPS